MNILRKLAFRTAAPIVLLAALFWLVLYLFVVDTINYFAREQAQENLRSFSREIFGICNRAFEELMRSGKMNDPTAVRIGKALAMGDVEDYLDRFGLHGLIFQSNGSETELLMETEGAKELRSAMSNGKAANVFFSPAASGKHYFAYSFDFQPWGWRILVAQDSAAYKSLTERVRNMYWISGALLLVMALGLIIVENRVLNRPVNRIIKTLSAGEEPTREHIEELDFLSRSIADMMRTLEEREARLRESENRYRTIFQTTGTAIAIIEEDATVSMVNTRFEEDAGLSKQEIEGKKIWTDFVAPEDRGRLKAIAAFLPAGSDSTPGQHELKFLDSQGNRKDMLLTAGIIPGTTQTLVSLVDITDRKREELERRLEQEARAAEALRKTNAELAEEIEARKRTEESLRISEGRFRAIFETAEDCVFIKNARLEYTHANPACVRLLEKDLAHIIGKTDEALSLDSSYTAHARSLESRVLEGETFETEHTLTWKGWPVSLNVVRFPLRDSAGETFGICGIARDVTDRKATQNQRVAAPTKGYRSPKMQEVWRQVMLGAETDSTILFLGESGVGKDYWARFLHDHSPRAGSSFLSINCAALSPELVESELFGHEAGAFTGARGRKRGLLELAEGGTLLLNEIGEMPWALQSKLLTFMDTQTITRVGGETPISVDARILAATNRDLVKEIELGRFRLDLFYRLAVFSITIPPLRERANDIPNFVHELLARLSERMGLAKLPVVDMAAMETLLGYNWPGNIRELQNVLERSLILCDRERITLKDLGLTEPATKEPGNSDNAAFTIPLTDGRSFEEAINETKRVLIVRALERCGGSVKSAAALLSMTRNSIDHHIRRLGIRK